MPGVLYKQAHALKQEPLTSTQAEMSTELYRKKLSISAPSSGTDPRGMGCTRQRTFSLAPMSLGKCASPCTALQSAHLCRVVDDIDGVVKEVIQHAGANRDAA